MPEPDAPAVVLARLEGKLEKLDEKLDLRLDTILGEIKSGDREALQQVGFVNETVRSLEKRTDASFATMGARLQTVEGRQDSTDGFTNRAKGAIALVGFLAASGAVSLAINIIQALHH